MGCLLTYHMDILIQYDIENLSRSDLPNVAMLCIGTCFYSGYSIHWWWKSATTFFFHHSIALAITISSHCSSLPFPPSLSQRLSFSFSFWSFQLIQKNCIVHISTIFVQVVCVVGDVSFLHDTNGLAILNQRLEFTF